MVAAKGEPSTDWADAKRRVVGTTWMPWEDDSQKRWSYAESEMSLYCTLMS